MDVLQLYHIVANTVLKHKSYRCIFPELRYTCVYLGCTISPISLVLLLCWGIFYFILLPPVLHHGKRGQILGSVPNIEILVPVLHHKF